MWHFTIIIISEPNQLYPGDIFFIIELVELFEQKCIILYSKIEDLQPSFGFWLENHRPSCQVTSSLGSIIPSPKGTVF